MLALFEPPILNFSELLKSAQCIFPRIAFVSPGTQSFAEATQSVNVNLRAHDRALDGAFSERKEPWQAKRLAVRLLQIMHREA